MQKIPYNEAITWITQHVEGNPAGLTTTFATHFGVSRMAASTFVKQQVKAGYLRKSGSATRPHYALGDERRLFKTYHLPGADEAEIWAKDFAPYLDLPENIRNICHFGLTEMVNNANDHSLGHQLTLSVYQGQGMLQIGVLDNGLGIFKKIADALHLPDLKQALLELTKGKFTTDQKNHSGEGIFFTSRAFDFFSISANGLVFIHHDTHSNDHLHEEGPLVPAPHTGTGIAMQISLQSSRILREVFNAYTSNLDELAFDKTVIPVRLARLGSDNLISRSQAKRLLQRVDKFRFVELDFSDVEEIGQAFADEVFRVFANQHPEVKLEATNTTPEVRRMINRAIKTER